MDKLKQVPYQVYGRCLILIAAINVLCLVIKALGFDIFAIDVVGHNFVEFTKLIDEHIILKIIAGTITSTLMNIIYTLIIVKKWRLKNISMIVVVGVSTVLAVFKGFGIYTFVFDIITYFVIPVVVYVLECKHQRSWRVYVRSIFAFVVVLASNIAPLLYKSLGVSNTIDDNAYISIVYMIDIFITFAFWYLYVNAKEEQRRI